MRESETKFSLYFLIDCDEFLGCSSRNAYFCRGNTNSHGRVLLSSKTFFFESTTEEDPICKWYFNRISDVRLSKGVSQEITLVFMADSFVQIDANGIHEIQTLDNLTLHTIIFPKKDSADLWGPLQACFADGNIADCIGNREAQLQELSTGSSFQCRRFLPLVEQRGILTLTHNAIMFHPLFLIPGEASVTLSSQEINHFFPRHVDFSRSGVEFYGTSGEEAILSVCFVSPSDCDRAVEHMVQILGLRPFQITFAAILDQWQRREISNYEYLSLLNKMGSRSYCDASQYPVFPWILADYDSQTIDLTNESSFRDLSKPVGALSSTRLEALRERAEHLEAIEERPYLYSTHYSTAGYVSYYHVRDHPEYQILLQHGRYDDISRIFTSLSRSWAGVFGSSSDFKELIPEFYDQGFLAICCGKKNKSTSSLKQEESLPDLLLPPWAATASDFVTLHRAALESEPVSRTLHLWVDLIFGYAQRGNAAMDRNNLFHPACYPSNDSDAKKHMRHFGQVPEQLFLTPHPPRIGAPHTTFPILSDYCKALCDDMENAVMELYKLREAILLLNENPPLDSSSALSATWIRAEGKSVPVREGERFSLTFKKPSLVLMHSVGQSTYCTVCNSSAEVLALVDAKRDTKIRSFSDFEEPICRLVPAGPYVLLFSRDHSVYFLHCEQATIEERLMNFTDSPVTYSFSDFNTLTLATSNATVQLWHIANDDYVTALRDTALVELEASTTVSALHVHSNNDCIVIAGTLMVYGTVDGEVALHSIDGVERARFTVSDDFLGNKEVQALHVINEDIVVLLPFHIVTYHMNGTIHQSLSHSKTLYSPAVPVKGFSICGLTAETEFIGLNANYEICKAQLIPPNQSFNPWFASFSTDRILCWNELGNAFSVSVPSD